MAGLRFAPCLSRLIASYGEQHCGIVTIAAYLQSVLALPHDPVMEAVDDAWSGPAWSPTDSNICSNQWEEVGVSELRSAVDELIAADLDDLDNTALGELIVKVSRQRDRLDGFCHRLIAEHDRRLAWKADGARSEKEWLQDACRLSSGEAAARTNTARNLEVLPATAAALADGTISAGQARVAAQAVRDLPSDALGGLDWLVAETTDVNAAELRAAVNDYAHAVAPDSLAARQERAWRTRRLQMTRAGDDGAILEAKLDKVGAETVPAALAPLAAPRGEQDDRTPEQRRADALVELARRSLDGGELGETGGGASACHRRRGPAYAARRAGRAGGTVGPVGRRLRRDRQTVGVRRLRLSGDCQRAVTGFGRRPDRPHGHAGTAAGAGRAGQRLRWLSRTDLMVRSAPCQALNRSWAYRLGQPDPAVLRLPPRRP